MSDQARLPWPDPPLTGDGVVLRPWRADDLDDALAGSRDPLVPRFTRVPPDNSRENIEGHFGAQEQRRHEGAELVFALADVDSDRFLGTISLLRLNWEEGVGEIGYWTAPWGRGRGATTTATRLLADWALRTLPFARIELMADVDNVASQAVAERAGFVREGVLRERWPLRNGKRVDQVIFSRLPSDP